MGHEIKCSKSDVRNGLAEYFRYKAQSRRQRTDNQSNKIRNNKSALAMDRLADYCLLLRDDDAMLARVFALPWCFNERGKFTAPIADGISSSEKMAKDYGFNDDKDPAEFFEAWVIRVEKDYSVYAQTMSEYADNEPKSEGTE